MTLGVVGSGGGAPGAVCACVNWCVCMCLVEAVCGIVCMFDVVCIEFGCVCCSGVF